ncbi:G5 domain-containing protein [Clostridium estertheticum]|uniref:3D domain-containing protein n=1 Tax=Clostridium estertheticum TaxID=238834 RepID=UPI001CD0A55E|nr:3D domain-containing protein [Clostridium estertheticum]MBZ9686381.1 G5 domain-containing protein [Clostridium estertheticum]
MIIIVKFIKGKQKKIVMGFVLMAIIATTTAFMSITRKNISVVVDGKQIKLVTYQKTVETALKKANINIAVKDKIDKDLNSKLVNNDVITINHAINLKVFVDNKELNIASAEKDIALMLNAEKIGLSPNDKVYPLIENKLSKGMNVIITRVKTETVQEKKPIDFKTVIKDDKDTLKSQSSVLQNGIRGEKNITLNVTYENGKEVNREVIKEIVVKEPQHKIIAQGTKPAISISRGASAKTLNVRATSTSKTINVKATAYCAVDGNDTYTSSGRKAVRNPSGYSTIAVDPNVIPLGTRLYVEGYGNAIAADKGSGVKGKFIDVFFNTLEEASNWGVKYLKVTILD